jgi:hypothetical protein
MPTNPFKIVSTLNIYHNAFIYLLERIYFMSDERNEECDGNVYRVIMAVFIGQKYRAALCNSVLAVQLCVLLCNSVPGRATLCNLNATLCSSITRPVRSQPHQLHSVASSCTVPITQEQPVALHYITSHAAQSCTTGMRLHNVMYNIASNFEKSLSIQQILSRTCLWL